jgi:threonine-phosphate decarboxylase
MYFGGGGPPLSEECSLMHFHGGNIYLLAERLGVRESEVIDFSASINPLGVPGSVLSALTDQMKYLFNYPDPDARKLRVKIAKHIGTDPESVICGNGSTELIYLIVRALRPKKVLVPAPTFSEYEQAAKCAGAETVYLPLKKEDCFDLSADEFISAMSGSMHDPFAIHDSRAFDMAFLCNPNNPTGRLIRRDDMLKIADAARDMGCVLVVDEAFIDFCPGASIVDEVSTNPCLVVLRSLTKMYALSGLRVGYAVLPSSLSYAVMEAKEPWTVNSLAQIAGVAALDDDAYRAETFSVIEKEKRVLEEGFVRIGIHYLPSSANYYLLQMEKAGEVAARLREKRILVRECSNFSGLDNSYIRVAVKSENDNRRLIEEISLCPVY